jgi:hypothetical protein
MDMNHIIEPERHGIWIAAGFTVALLALVLGFVSLERVNNVLVGTQAEVLALNKKIEGMKNGQAKTQPAPQAQAAPAPAAK